MPKVFESASGTWTGSGVAQVIALGFKPKLIVMYNQTDADQLSIYMDGMSDAKVISMVSLISLIATNGITLSETGFTVGTDNAINKADKVFKYFAIGGN